MSIFLNTRRRQIATKGRTAKVRRPTSTTAFTDVTVMAVVRGYKPEQIVGGVQQGDAQAFILNDEIAAASWPGPPRVRDQFQIDGRTWSVVGNEAIYDGPTCIGHTLWIRGAS